MKMSNKFFNHKTVKVTKGIQVRKGATHVKVFKFYISFQLKMTLLVVIF